MSNIKKRLDTLREEFKKGEQMLADLDREADEVRSSLLRIQGAIQVLEELENEDNNSSGAE